MSFSPPIPHLQYSGAGKHEAQKKEQRLDTKKVKEFTGFPFLWFNKKYRRVGIYLFIYLF